MVDSGLKAFVIKLKDYEPEELESVVEHEIQIKWERNNCWLFVTNENARIYAGKTYWKPVFQEQKDGTIEVSHQEIIFVGKKIQ